MYQPYRDIRELAGNREPLWHDENGVPRYVPFHPNLCADIYARRAALIEIRCQGCPLTFQVAWSWSIRIGATSIECDEEPGFGDAPFHDCAGCTMTTDVVRVVEMWESVDCVWRKLPCP